MSFIIDNRRTGNQMMVEMPASQHTVLKIYHLLMKTYGPQGWWPLLNVNNTEVPQTGSSCRYHPCEYDYPRSDAERFEIAVGAILTQNTSWLQVQTALQNLHNFALLSPQSICQTDHDILEQAIRPSGYFRQKRIKLQYFAQFFSNLNGRIPARDELLELWGIGPETADSILLYAYHQPCFVVDAYTRRLLTHLQLLDEKASYAQIQTLFHQSLEPDITLYQEYHALIVEHAKQHYSRKPYGTHCFLAAALL